MKRRSLLKGLSAAIGLAAINGKVDASKLKAPAAKAKGGITGGSEAKLFQEGIAEGIAKDMNRTREMAAAEVFNKAFYG